LKLADVIILENVSNEINKINNDDKMFDNEMKIDEMKENRILLRNDVDV
jgi:hypothetical protein